jgi:hypothetical protein
VRELLNVDVYQIIPVINNVIIDTRLKSRYTKLLRVAYVDVEPYLNQVSKPHKVYLEH